MEPGRDVRRVFLFPACLCVAEWPVDVVVLAWDCVLDGFATADAYFDVCVTHGQKNNACKNLFE